MHLTALRSKKTPLAETTEKLESLRQKQEEVQNNERQFRRDYEKKLAELERREEELDQREVWALLVLVGPPPNLYSNGGAALL
jgi:hypothetical protein